MNENEVEFVGKVRPLRAAGDLFEIIGPAGLMIFRNVDERYLQKHGYPVPERTTAVTVYLTEWDERAVITWDEIKKRRPEHSLDGVVHQLADAIRAQREADQ